MFDLLLVYVCAIQLVTFVVWGFDKWKARRDGRRVPERVLLLLTLAGGAVGAWTGVRLFRHKSSKRSFLWKLVLVSPGLLGVLWLLWEARPPSGS